MDKERSKKIYLLNLSLNGGGKSPAASVRYAFQLLAVDYFYPVGLILNNTRSEIIHATCLDSAWDDAGLSSRFPFLEIPTVLFGVSALSHCGRALPFPLGALVGL